MPHRKPLFFLELLINCYELLRLSSLVSFNPFVYLNKKELLVPGPKGKKYGFPYLEYLFNVLYTSFLVFFSFMLLYS